MLLRFPKLFDLRSDPFERADEDSKMFYYKWAADHMFLLVPAQALVAQWIETLKQFPPRQKATSFNLEEVMNKLEQSSAILEGAASGSIPKKAAA